MNNALNRAVNIILRVATLGARFVFIFFLAKYLDPASLGYYGIFAATIGYSIYIVGLDFYAYVSREIIKTSVENRGRLLKGQAALSSLLYFAFLPFVIFILIKSEWPDSLAWWFIPILVIEHFNQEMSRLLVVLNAQVMSSLISFVRQGCWSIAVIAVMLVDNSSRNLNVVMGLWLVAGVVAATVTIVKLKQFNISGWMLGVDWVWVKKGVSVSLSLLLATLVLRSIQAIDRYWLESLGGIEMVGAYVLLIGVANSLLLFLDAAIFSFSYPLLIELNHKRENELVRQEVKKLFWYVAFICLIFGVVSHYLLPYLLEWIGKSVYLTAFKWYPWLLFATIFNALSMVPHYGLYAQGFDKPIIYSHITSLFVFLFATWTMSEYFGYLAVPIGLTVTFAFIFAWKSYAYWVYLKID